VIRPRDWLILWHIAVAAGPHIVIMDVAHTETFARSCRGPTSTFQRDGIQIGHVFPSQPQGRHATTRSIGVRRTTSRCTRHVGDPNNARPHKARGQHPVAAARTRWRHGGELNFLGIVWTMSSALLFWVSMDLSDEVAEAWNAIHEWALLSDSYKWDMGG
jgi:hypothetical protein